MSFSTPVQVPPFNPTIEFDPDQRYALDFHSHIRLILREYNDEITGTVYIQISPECMKSNGLFSEFLKKTREIANTEERTEANRLDDRRMNPRYAVRDIRDSFTAILVSNKSDMEDELRAFEQLRPVPYFITKHGLLRIDNLGNIFDPPGKIVRCTPFHVSELGKYMHSQPR